MSKKKINPRRIPVSLADMKKNANKATDEAIHLAFAIFLTVLLDYHGFTREQIQDVWHQADKLSEEIMEGRINIRDLLNVLNEEYGVLLEK